MKIPTFIRRLAFWRSRPSSYLHSPVPTAPIHKPKRSKRRHASHH